MMASSVSSRFIQNLNELMLPLQGETWTLVGGELVGQDRGNYGVEKVGRQREKVISQCPSEEISERTPR